MTDFVAVHGFQTSGVLRMVLNCLTALTLFIFVGCSGDLTQPDPEEAKADLRSADASGDGSENSSVLESLPDLQGEETSASVPAIANSANLVKFKIPKSYNDSTVDAYVKGRESIKAVMVEEDASSFTYVIPYSPTRKFDVIIFADTVDGTQHGNVIPQVDPKGGTIDLGTIELFGDLGKLTGNILLGGEQKYDHSKTEVKVLGMGADATTNQEGDFSIFPFLPNYEFDLSIHHAGYHSKLIKGIKIGDSKQMNIGEITLEPKLSYNVSASIKRRLENHQARQCNFASFLP